MRMSLIADGTRGDVQPFLGLAHALRRRDHAVQLVTNASHARFVDPLVAEGVIASAVYFPVDWADVFAGDEAVVAALAKGDDLAYMRALMDVWTRSAGVVAPVALDAVSAFSPDAIISGTGPMMVSMPLATLLDIPLFHGNYLPLAFSHQDWPMPCGSSGHVVLIARGALAALALLAGLGPVGAVAAALVAPSLPNTLAFLAYREFGSRLLIDGYNAVRNLYGLKHETRRDMWRHYQHGVPRVGSYTGALFRSPVATREATGYWHPPDCLDDDDGGDVRERIEAFCARERGRGRRVVSIGWGSMIVCSRAHLSALAAAAAAIADVSVVLLGGWSGICGEGVLSARGVDGDGSSTSSPPIAEMLREAEAELTRRGFAGGLGRWTMMHALSVPAAPHGFLYPRMDAVVHHGGSGTTHAGVRAGVPAVVTPVLGDQSGWAERVAAAGAGLVGRTLAKVGAAELAGMIGRVVGDERFRAAAGRLRERVAGEGGAGEAVRRLEEGVLEWSVRQPLRVVAAE